MNELLKAWEGRAYDYCMENLKTVGFPVDGLAFDLDLVTLFHFASHDMMTFSYNILFYNLIIGY